MLARCCARAGLWPRATMPPLQGRGSSWVAGRPGLSGATDGGRGVGTRPMSAPCGTANTPDAAAAGLAECDCGPAAGCPPSSLPVPGSGSAAAGAPQQRAGASCCAAPSVEQRPGLAACAGAAVAVSSRWLLTLSALAPTAAGAASSPVAGRLPTGPPTCCCGVAVPRGGCSSLHSCDSSHAAPALPFATGAAPPQRPAWRTAAWRTAAWRCLRRRCRRAASCRARAAPASRRRCPQAPR